MKLDLAGIRARAEAAQAYVESPWGVFVSVEVIEAPDEGLSDDEVEDIVNKYIAGMDPPTTLALVDEMERGQTHEISLDEGNARCSAEAFWLWKITVEYYEDLCDAIKADAEAEAVKLRVRVAELEEAQTRG